MTDRAWYIVGTLSGLRCEEHIYAPDNALAGPYRTDEIAVRAMQQMIERDRWMVRLAWALLAGMLVVVGALVIGRVV